MRSGRHYLIRAQYIPVHNYGLSLPLPLFAVVDDTFGSTFGPISVTQILPIIYPMPDHLIPFTDGHPSPSFLALIRQHLVPSRDSSAFTRPLSALLFLPTIAIDTSCAVVLPPRLYQSSVPYAPPCFVASKGKSGRVRKLIPVHDIFHQVLPL